MTFSHLWCRRDSQILCCFLNPASGNICNLHSTTVFTTYARHSGSAPCFVQAYSFISLCTNVSICALKVEISLCVILWLRNNKYVIRNNKYVISFSWVLTVLFFTLSTCLKYFMIMKQIKNNRKHVWVMSFLSCVPGYELLFWIHAFLKNCFNSTSIYALVKKKAHWFI